MIPALGAASSAVLAIARDVGDDRALAVRICRACVEGLAVDGAALSVLTASAARHTLHATDATAETLEELQFSLNEGACIDAATTGLPVFIEDMQANKEARRWPMFTAGVIERTDARALLALPLQWGKANLGVLDLYRRLPVGLDDEQRRDALAAVDAAALMMLTMRVEPPGDDLGGRSDSWLEPAVASRAEVHQATGMVLMQLGISAADALARMRAYAFAEQRLLVDVARDVVERRLSFTEEQTER